MSLWTWKLTFQGAGGSLSLALEMDGDLVGRENFHAKDVEEVKGL